MLLYVDSQFASPYAMSVFVALRAKGLAFETSALDLAANQHRTRSFSGTSFTSRVPTLVDGEFALSESSAIEEYLEELHPNPRLYPVEPRARARARQVQAWLRSDLIPLREERPTEVIFYHPTAVPLSGEGQAAAEKLIRVATALLTRGDAHLFDDWSIADTDLALMLNRLVANGDPVPARLAEYTRRQWQRPAVQEWAGLPRPPLTMSHRASQTRHGER